MSVQSNNATAPTPAFAPGAEGIDPAEVARDLGRRWPGGMDPRVREIIPAFDAPFFQAGLAGYSDAAMRIVARRHGCPFCVTEALLDRTLLAGGRGFTKADLGELHDNVPGGPEDHPLACQIMGSDPEEMAAAALKVAEQGRRPDKAYRLMAYRHLSPEEAAEIATQHLRGPGGQQVGRFDPTEGLEEMSCEDAVDEANEVAEWQSGGVAECARDAASESRASDSCDARRSPSVSPSPTLPLGHSATLPLRPALSFETVDVNLACPVKKIKAKARGGHWLAEPDGAIRILEAVRAAVPAGIPCTVKLRRSYDDTPEMAANFERIFDAAYAMGYAWATVHARTVEQKYVGPSRWTFLRDLVRRHPDKPVFGSGDVWEVGDIFRMIGYTGVSGVSVARGCIGNPWIFRQARQMLAGEPPSPPTIAEQRAVLEEHFRLAVAVQGEKHASRTMRKFGIRFAAHHPRSEEVRLRFIAVEGLEGWRRVLDEHYG
jgi:tRNA-dihydrouridine synthase